MTMASISSRLALQNIEALQNPGYPTVVVIPGIGSSPASWAASIRELNSSHPHIPIYLYSRSSPMHNPSIPRPATSVTIASDLYTLLQNADISSPLIIIAHSWGGVLARELIALLPPSGPISLAGLLLLEPNQENTLDILDWRTLAFSPVIANISLPRTDQLSPSEHQDLLASESSPEFQSQSTSESANYAASFPILKSKNQLHWRPAFLGSKPLYIIKASTFENFQKLGEAGIKAGQGTDEERKAFLEFLETWEQRDEHLQREVLSLSDVARFVDLRDREGVGHDVQMTAPDSVVDGLKWILEKLKEDVKKD